MNPSLLILIFLQLLSSHLLIAADPAPAPLQLPSKTLASYHRHHHKGKCFRSWCRKALHSKLCASIVESDPRECWKATPQGIALILAKAAKANRRRTVSFIKSHLKNATNADIQQGLDNCLSGYKTVGKALDISMCELSDHDARSEFLEVVRRMGDEVIYDCQWFQPQPFPLVLRKMHKRVNRFSAILQTAVDMINLA